MGPLMWSGYASDSSYYVSSSQTRGQWCVCVYLDEVVGAEAEELQQLEVAACGQDVLDHRGFQQDLFRGDKQGHCIFLNLFYSTWTSVTLQFG